MKCRKDSPFYGMTEEQIDRLLELQANGELLCDIAEWWVYVSKNEINMEQVRRFLSRVKRERMLQDAIDSGDEMKEWAAGAGDGKRRDGLIEAARQQLFEAALEKGDSAVLLELYRSAHEERAREREVEVERRKAAATEERVKIGWRQLELQKAEAVLRLLPRLRALLEEPAGSAEETLSKVREVVGVGGARLLGEGSGARVEDVRDVTGAALLNDETQGHK
jgi:hypothetical protein